MPTDRLGIGFIGSGFNARFHLQAFVGVRDADVRGVWSPNAANAESAAELARSLDVGDGAGVRAPSPTWSRTPPSTRSGSCGPNHARIENVEEIVARRANPARGRSRASRARSRSRATSPRRSRSPSW